MDPIADEFAWVNTYNYAENEPVAHIDLHGLQKWPANFIFNSALSDFNQQLGSPAEKINSATSSISPETRNRASLATKGISNLTLGVLGTAAGATVAGGSGGFAAPVGGTMMTLSLTEAGIGAAQITDAIFGEGDSESVLHQSTSGPGLVANAAGSEHAALFDVGGEVLPGLLGGGLKAATGFEDALSAVKSASNGRLGNAAIELFQAKDAFGDFTGLIQESGNSFQKSGPPLSKKEIEDINSFINKSNQ